MYQGGAIPAGCFHAFKCLSLLHICCLYNKNLNEKISFMGKIELIQLYFKIYLLVSILRLKCIYMPGWSRSFALEIFVGSQENIVTFNCNRCILILMKLLEC